MSSTNGYINDDVWSLIKSYLFHGKFEAIDLIKYHVGAAICSRYA